MVKISIIICAFNRSQSVSELLRSLLRLQPAKDCPYEIFLVDNNSSDGTRGAVEAYIPRFSGKLRYLFEPRQGKPYALNLGIKESSGEVLAFIDDDCLVENDYIIQVNNVFAGHGGIDFMGGKVLPCWVGGECPRWLRDIVLDTTEYTLSQDQYWRRNFFRGPLAILDYGEEPFYVDSSKKYNESLLFYGPNMAVKRSAFDKIGGFALEKVITQDTDICLRLLRSGSIGLYAPNVKVYHNVPVANITPAYYCRWYYQRGKFFELREVVPRKFYHPLGIHNEFILKTFLLYARSVMARSLLERIHLRCQALFNFGQMAQMARKNLR